MHQGAKEASVAYSYCELLSIKVQPVAGCPADDNEKPEHLCRSGHAFHIMTLGAPSRLDKLAKRLAHIRGASFR